MNTVFYGTNVMGGGGVKRYGKGYGLQRLLS